MAMQRGAILVDCVGANIVSTTVHSVQVSSSSALEGAEPRVLNAVAYCSVASIIVRDNYASARVSMSGARLQTHFRGAAATAETLRGLVARAGSAAGSPEVLKGLVK